MVRCFAAVEVASPAVRRALESAQNTLRLAFGAGTNPVKWVPSHQFHFTLKFFGEIDDRAALRAAAALREGANCSPFLLEVAGLGAFPNPDRPSVLWAGTGKGQLELVSLATRVEEAMVRAGFRREPRPFRPHLTLGRVREQARVPAQVRERLSAPPVSYGAWTVERLVLMRSELLPTGPRYTVLEAAPLGPADSQPR